MERRTNSIPRSRKSPTSHALAADSISESSDPVRLYLKEMGNFQLLSREQEVEIAKRIEAGENEVEEEILRSPVTLDLVIEMGARVEAGEADLRDLFEENEEPDDADEERGPRGQRKATQRAIHRDHQAQVAALPDRRIRGETQATAQADPEG